MFKKIFAFLRLANNSIPVDNVSNIEIDAIVVEETIQIENLGAKLFPKLQNYTSKEKFDIPSILNITCEDFYNKLENWLFYDYLKNFENLTEAKYKVVTLGAFLEVKNIRLESMPSVESMVETISEEIIRKNESSFNIRNLFARANTIDKMRNPFYKTYQDKNSHFDNIFNEDKNNQEKINIAKKIWSDFSSVGLLTQLLISNSANIECFAELQHFKFNQCDLLKLKENSKTQKDYKPMASSSMYSLKKHKHIWQQLIVNEDSIINLELIEEVLINDAYIGHAIVNSLVMQGITPMHNESENEFLKMISKKIDYLELITQIGEVQQLSQPKSKKIKI